MLSAMQTPTSGTRRRRQRRRRGEVKVNASVLLLSLVLLADKPNAALGLAHSARYSGGRQRAGGGGGATRTPAAGTTPPAARQQRVLVDLVALRARRPGRRSPSRLAGAAGAEPGKIFEAPVVEGGVVVGQAAAVVANNGSAGGSAVVGASREKVGQTEERGANGAWRKAMEQLEKERRGGREPVSGL